ncbi:MAG: thiamine phosphate synthase [Acidimicrobiales bacterium]
MTGSLEDGSHWGIGARRLYLCTPDRPDLEEFVAACIDGGVDIVQLREKHLCDERLLERAEVVQAVCRGRRVPFIVNDRPDLAAEIGADGVHVGQDDTSPVDARRILGERAIVGLSTHEPDELAAACGEGSSGAARVPVDYLSAGPVTPTPTKPGRLGTGVGYIGAAVRRSPWPVWVTGGVDPTTVGPLVEVGARHFVVVRWLNDASDPEARSRQLRCTIEDAIDSAISCPGDEGH